MCLDIDQGSLFMATGLGATTTAKTGVKIFSHISKGNYFWMKKKSAVHDSVQHWGNFFWAWKSVSTDKAKGECIVPGRVFVHHENEPGDKMGLNAALHSVKKLKCQTHNFLIQESLVIQILACLHTKGTW
uniref:Uncharacterized protein n=1 Tax=Salvator merianae TaxID=96440 RepID=A0A8D0DVE8_SALMN